MNTSAAQAAGEMPSEPEAEKMWKYFNDRVRGKTAGEYGPFTNMDWHAAVTLRAHAEALLAQRDKALVALNSIKEYWNQDRNDKAMFDACWFAKNTAESVLMECWKEFGK